MRDPKLGSSSVENDGLKDRPEMRVRLARAMRVHAALILALALVGTSLGGLLIGYEPVGGDPDRLYRPIKSELARALGEGRLPFWSSRFGLGVPLIAESHVAAFYPPNLLLYRVFDLSIAYRLSMWLHYVAMVAATYLYARSLNLSAWGSALAGVVFALCGFAAIHSSHEPFYSAMPYLPLALFVTERYLVSGHMVWLALLASCLGVQWSLGHFQIQTWTGALVILTGMWRAILDLKAWRRALGIIAATAWGAALAALQLGLSWQFADSVRQTNRSPSELLHYSFPPAHWFELVLPRLIRELRLGPNDPYWVGQQTWGYEAVLYVGTIPLILAFIAAVGRPASRSTVLWRILVPVSFAVATMPRWWPAGFLQLVALPAFGYFRVAARHMLLTSLGLAILAGEGFETSISKMRFRLGMATALVFGGCGAAVAFLWTKRPDVQLVSLWGGLTGGFVWGAVAWLAAIAGVLAWRSRRLHASVPLVATGIELALLFYAGTTQWGWAIALPKESPILNELIRLSASGLVGGQTENLPVRANLATGAPYVGLAHPPANRILILPQELLLRGDAIAPHEKLDPAVLTRWLRRCRVSHVVGRQKQFLGLGKFVGSWQDPALDQIFPRMPSEPANEPWSIVYLGDPMPEARVAAHARTIADRPALVNRLSRADDRDQAWFLAEDRIPPRPDARSARLVSWDGTVGTIEHEGTCDLVVTRTFDLGWLARIDDGPEQSVVPVDGGFLAVRVEGSGTHRVTLRYQPQRLAIFATISLVAAASIAGVVVGALWNSLRRRTYATS
jgi:hypothetical protein